MVGSVMVLVDCTDASFSVSDNIATPSVYGAALVMKVISPNGSLRLLAHEQSSLFANASQQDKIILNAFRGSVGQELKYYYILADLSKIVITSGTPVSLI